MYSELSSLDNRESDRSVRTWTPDPNHLLTLKTQVVLPPPGKFESPDQYCRKRWRRVQYLANQLWLRCQKEYCALLQKRQKWTTPKRCMKEGDVVLVCDNESPRNQWPLAVVSKVFPSCDQLVRNVQIMTAKGGERKFFERPVHKLVLLLAKENNESWFIFCYNQYFRNPRISGFSYRFE